MYFYVLKFKYLLSMLSKLKVNVIKMIFLCENNIFHVFPKKKSVLLKSYACFQNSKIQNTKFKTRTSKVNFDFFMFVLTKIKKKFDVKYCFFCDYIIQINTKSILFLFTVFKLAR